MKSVLLVVCTLFMLLIGESRLWALNAPATIDTTPNATADEARLWNLQDADILSVINEVSLETGKNFVVDPHVTGKISLVSSKPIKPDQVYDVFLSVLSLLGYSAIPSGDVVKIVPNMESAEYPTRVASNQAPGKGDEVVVRVIPLENSTASQLIPVIRPLLPQWSNVSAYTPGNVLIVVGRASNIQRIIKLIQNVERASDNNIDVIPLHHAQSAQVAAVLSNLQATSKTNGESTAVSVAADERSNSLLLSGNHAARLRMRMLINDLDTPSTGSQGNTQVVYLKYLQAKEFAPIIGKIAQNILGKETAATHSTATVAQIGAPTNPTKSDAAKNEPDVPENLTNIQAEPNTNALIITAPPNLMKALLAIISKLDIRPAQVLVEAIIVEINQDDLNTLGIQWGTLTTNEEISATNNDRFLPYGMGTVGVMPGIQLKAVLSLLQEKTGADILSTPSVVVLDNQKATLKVGKDVPWQNGTYATTGNTSTVTPFTTIEDKPVLLQLDVTPQLNLGDAVRLTLDLRNDSLQNPDNPGLNPITNTSEIKNSVIINSNDVLVLGGLISNNITDTVAKVPLLGDIPIVGIAFQHKSRRLEKKNLMVFIKPTILRNTTDATMITNSKYNMIRNAQINWPENLSGEGKQKLQNILPPWKNKKDLPIPFEK